MDETTFVARGTRATTSAFRFVAVLAAAFFVAYFCNILLTAMFIGGGEGTGRMIGYAFTYLVLQLVLCALFMFFAGTLAGLCWSAWPGANPNMRNALHQMTAPGGGYQQPQQYQQGYDQQGGYQQQQGGYQQGGYQQGGGQYPQQGGQQ